MKPMWMRRHCACPNCGLIIEIEDCPKSEGWAKPYLDLPAVPFDCPRCKAHYTPEDFYELNQDKWTNEMKEEPEQP